MNKVFSISINLISKFTAFILNLKVKSSKNEF